MNEEKVPEEKESRKADLHERDQSGDFPWHQASLPESFDFEGVPHPIEWGQEFDQPPDKRQHAEDLQSGPKRREQPED